MIFNLFPPSIFHRRRPVKCLVLPVDLACSGWFAFFGSSTIALFYHATPAAREGGASAIVLFDFYALSIASAACLGCRAAH